MWLLIIAGSFIDAFIADATINNSDVNKSFAEYRRIITQSFN
jgi:hypothetical protein